MDYHFDIYFLLFQLVFCSSVSSFISTFGLIEYFLLFHFNIPIDFSPVPFGINFLAITMESLTSHRN